MFVLLRYAHSEFRAARSGWSGRQIALRPTSSGLRAAMVLKPTGDDVAVVLRFLPLAVRAVCVLGLVSTIGLAGCGPAPSDSERSAPIQSMASKSAPAPRAPTETSSRPRPQIEVIVSPDFREIYYVYEGYVTRGESISTELPVFDEGRDTYLVQTRVNGPGLSLLVLDDRYRQANNLNPEFLEQRPLNGEEQFRLRPAPSDQGTLMIVANSTAVPVWLSIRIDRAGRRPLSVTEPLAEYMSLLPRAVAATYHVPDLRVEVKPCGFVNAIATNDQILFCSELVNDLIAHDEFMAISPILAHELAHKLLWSWQIAGWDNEDLADEFAGLLFAQINGGPRGELDAFVRWLERGDPVAERLARDLGDTHSLGIERAMALRRILADPAPYRARWDARLAAFKRE